MYLNYFEKQVLLFQHFYPQLRIGSMHRNINRRHLISYDFFKILLLHICHGNIITIQNTPEWVNPNTSFTLTEKSALEIELGDLTNFEGEAENFTLKIALFKGDTARTYEPYFEGFKHAEVERIENKGANLLPFPYKEEGKTVSGITYTIQADRGIRRVGTATATTGIILSTDIEFEDGKTYYKSPNDLQIAYKRADGRTGYALPSFTWSKEYTLIQVYLQTNIDDTKNEVVYPMISSTKTDYIPYREPQVIEIPEAVKALEGYGREGSYIKFEKGKYTFEVTKDENLEDLAKPIVTDITHLFPKDFDELKVVPGGTLRFVNAEKMPVPSTIGYVKRRE